MKKIFFYMVMISLNFALYGNPSDDVIREADAMIADRKYESAVEILYRFDPENKCRDIVVKKSGIFRKYYVQCINCSIFALKDLEGGETLDELRNSTGKFRFRIFDGISILKSLLNDENGQVSNELGLYYYFIWERAGDSFNSKLGDVNKLVYDNLIRAYETYNYYDPESWEILGKYYFNNGNIEEAFTIYDRLIKDRKDDPEINYTYGFILFHNKQYEESIPYFSAAAKYYKREDYKLEAEGLLGLDYYLLGQYEKASLIFDDVITNNVYEYRIYGQFIDSLLKTGKLKEANRYSRTFLTMEPGNSFVSDTLLPVYFQNDALSEYGIILDNLIDEYKDDSAAKANFLFQKANVLINQGNPRDDVVKYLKLARQEFLKSSGPSNQAVQVIDDYLNQGE